MALPIAPVSDELELLCRSVISEKFCILHAVWLALFAPLLAQRLRDIQTGVAGPSVSGGVGGGKTAAVIGRTIAHLNDTLSRDPPFTLLRIAELVVDYTCNGYAVDTPTAVEKYVTALFKVVNVQSLELEIASLATGASPTELLASSESRSPLGCVSLEDYAKHDLPMNIKFQALNWDEPLAVVSEESPPRKRSKTEYPADYRLEVLT